MLYAVTSMKLLLICTAFTAAGSALAATQTRPAYPAGNIRLLFGFPAGTDTTTRLLADKLAEALGKPVIVDNVTGAAGNIAADRTAKAKPDGLTIGMLTGANIVINPALYKSLSYDPIKDLVPISLVFEYPNVLVINSQVPAKTVSELVALARMKPGQLTYGHNGVGTTTHLSAELFKAMAGISIQEIPYRGLPPMVPDLLTGRITMTFNTPSASMPLVWEGKLHALAVTSPTRAPYATDVPTMGSPVSLGLIYQYGLVSSPPQGPRLTSLI